MTLNAQQQEYSRGSGSSLLVCFFSSLGSGSMKSLSESIKEKEVLEEHRIDLISAKDQIRFLRMGVELNISEIAAMMFVKRPTIYEWMKGKEPSLRNQKRLEEICRICSQW